MTLEYRAVSTVGQTQQLIETVINSYAEDGFRVIATTPHLILMERRTEEKPDA